MLCIKVMETVSTEKIFVVSAFADVILMYFTIWPRAFGLLKTTSFILCSMLTDIHLFSIVLSIDSSAC